jgi:Lipase maturation factor
MIWETGDYWLTRLVFQRSLGVVYLIAFLCALNQFRPLLGERGLLPVPLFVRRVPFRRAPSLFFLFPQNWAFAAAAWAGIILSCIVVAGIADRFASWFNALVWIGIWTLYLSFVNVGQTFYAFGWESILLEGGFLAIFLGACDVRTPILVIYLVRWLEFRVMLGAGLIKLRGDRCWSKLTCLNYHYETQPLPNPLSWYFHAGPEWTHKAGVLFNHFAELVVPFGYFLPQPVATIAAVITIIFQGLVFASGNLSWLNFLTMILAIPAIDGRYLSHIVPLEEASVVAPTLIFQSFLISLASLIALLSIQPIRNMLSRHQVMNTSYNPFHLVGTYGAFGSITRRRFEVVIEGTRDNVLTPTTQWQEYEFKGKPNQLIRRPPQIAPYHLRLDWLMWFAAMSNYYQHPWFVHFIAKLLQNDKFVLKLLKSNPFPERAPKFVRAELYKYRFANAEIRRRTGRWWTRELVGAYFPPVSLETPFFRDVLRQQGWL